MTMYFGNHLLLELQSKISLIEKQKFKTIILIFSEHEKKHVPVIK